jgi:hypothetical protein
MKKLAAFLAISVLGMGVAAAGAVPKLDIEKTCRRAQPLSAGEKSAFQSCMNDETEAQKELIKTWSTFKPGAQATCVEETKIGGAPSYVELVTCLQLDKQAAEAARENQKELKMPVSKPADPTADPGAAPKAKPKSKPKPVQ